MPRKRISPEYTKVNAMNSQMCNCPWRPSSQMLPSGQCNSCTRVNKLCGVLKTRSAHKEFRNPMYAPLYFAGLISARYDLAAAPAQAHPVPAHDHSRNIQNYDYNLPVSHRPTRNIFMLFALAVMHAPRLSCRVRRRQAKHHDGRTSELRFRST